MVVVSSIYAFTNGVGAIPYAMSKAAVEQFGRALRVELAPHGASATVAYFGFIDTEMVHRAIDSDELADMMLKSLPRPLAQASAAERRRRGDRARDRAPPAPHHPPTPVDDHVGAAGHPRAARRRPCRARQSAQNLARLIDSRAGEDQPTTAPELLAAGIESPGLGRAAPRMDAIATEAAWISPKLNLPDLSLASAAWKPSSRLFIGALRAASWGLSSTARVAPWISFATARAAAPALAQGRGLGWA